MLADFRTETNAVEHPAPVATAVATEPALVQHPLAPHTLEQTGLSFDLIEQLILKMLHFSGEMSGAVLGRRLGLQYSAFAPVLEHVKLQYLVELVGGGLVAGPAYVYRITEAGRERALLYLQQNQYVGPAPVPFVAYEAYMRGFAASRKLNVTRTRVREAFDSLVLGDDVLDQLGPAIIGGHSMFIYGAPGNGKTVISQATRNLLDGEIAIPYAVEAHGQIIQVFDAVVHDPLPPFNDQNLAVVPDHGLDLRWVRCRRPLVMVGGELTLESLDLAYGQTSCFYQAPVQMVANGGVLVIDDFGRQRCSPASMLNRWITPLESRIDYLTLQTGQKLPVPFAVLVIFATNINPYELVDEAFLRRIHYKVHSENPTLPQFKEIFERVCEQRGIEYDESIVDWLVRDLYTPRGIALRGCHPRDLIGQVVAFAEYLGEPVRLDQSLLERSFRTYFVNNTAPGAVAG